MPKDILLISEEEFSALPWPDQFAILRKILIEECACSGKTEKEASTKRRPYAEKREKLQAIHDTQWKNFWRENGPQ